MAENCPNTLNVYDEKGDAFRMFLLDELACEAEKEGKDIIRLTLGKTDLHLQENVRNVMTEALNDFDTSSLVSPQGLPELREAISLLYMRELGVMVSPENVFIDAGTSSIFRNILQIIIEVNDEVLLPLPYYPLYKISAQLAKANIKYYNIHLDTLDVDMDFLEKQVTDKTKAVIVNSPGNPLGNTITQKTLLRIFDLLPNRAFLIFDEIYENTKFNGEPSLTQFLLSDPRFKRLQIIITNSFSKAYRMYTKRVGWCILPNSLRKEMLEILQHTRLTVDPIVQYGAIEALKYTSEITILNNLHKERWNYTKMKLRNINSVRLLESKGGFYCTIVCNDFIRKKERNNCYELAVDILNKVNVAVVPGQDFGLPGTLRLSFTNKRYKEAIDRLYKYFNS